MYTFPIARAKERSGEEEWDKIREKEFRRTPGPRVANGTRASTLVRGKNLGGMHYDVPFLKFLCAHTVRRLVNFVTKIYCGLQQRGHTQPLKKKLNLHILARTTKAVRRLCLAAVTVRAYSTDRTYRIVCNGKLTWITVNVY